MSSVANPLADTWNALMARETVDVATRIFGLWSADAAPFYVFVLRPSPAAARRIMEIEQSLIAADIAHCIPRDFLHITVQSLGNIGEGGLTEEVAGGLADAVRTTLADVPPFAVRLRGVSSFGAAAFVGVYEDDAAMPLQRMQRAVVEALLADGQITVRHPERAYLPHLSICYYDRPYPTAAIVDALMPHRYTECGFLPVDAVELVRVVGDGTPYPPMETVRRIVLGGGV
jgi:2'-5' RNA ligase